MQLVRERPRRLASVLVVQPGAALGQSNLRKGARSVPARFLGPVTGRPRKAGVRAATQDAARGGVRARDQRLPLLAPEPATCRPGALIAHECALLEIAVRNY